MPWANITEIQRTPGRFCPRVELSRRSRPAAELAHAGARFGTDHPLWSKLFDLRAAQMRPGARVNLLYTVMHVLADPGVAVRIKQARERAAAETPKPKHRRGR